MASYSELPSAAQTAFAQLQDAAVAESVSRTAAHLHGSFSRKTVRGRGYWYFSFRDGEQVRQIYVGPDEPRVRALVEAKKAVRDDNVIESQAQVCVTLGATTLIPRHLRVVNRIADYGFFRAGGVLIGTHAFAGYANMLGVRWTAGDQTMDVDLAIPGKNVSIALPGSPTLDLHDALSTFEAGFLPTHSAGGIGATYVFKGDANFQVDFLTTLGRGGDTPRKIPALGVTAQPLKFLEFLVQDPTQTVLIDNAGHYCVVNVPAPARYAVHKLIVQGERDVRFRTKARKDLDQAAALFGYLGEHQARGLAAALKDARGRGPGWRRRVDAGLRALECVHPGISELR